MATLPENEAKERWCPFSRVALSMGMAANRTGAALSGLDANGTGYANIYHETRCLGSQCMLWEWSDPVAKRGWCGLSHAVDLES